MAKYIGSWDVTQPEWHEARQGRIGASEVAAIVGLSKWESRFALWHRKRGTLGEVDMNSAMTVGRYIEPAIADWFAEQHPEYMVLKVGTYVHERRDWQLCNPDRILGAKCSDSPNSLLECKYVVSDEAGDWGTPGTDQIPVAYMCQVQWQLDVMDLQTAYVAALMPGRFVEYVVRANAEDQALLRKAALEFLRTIEAGEEPDIDDSTATLDAVRKIHPDIDGSTVAIDPALHAAYRTAARDKARAEAAHRGLQAAVLHQMGSARYGHVDNNRVLRRQPANGGGVALHHVKPNLRRSA